MNPIEGWDFDGDTSLSIMSECHLRHHSIYFLESKDVAMEGSRIMGRAAECWPDPKTGLRLGDARLVPLEQMDALFIRKEPPFNADYLGLTYLLEGLRKRVLMINDPAGIRNVNEKLSTLHFPAVTPRGAAGQSVRVLKEALQRLKLKDAVLKRTDQKGGAGVLRTGLGDPQFDEKVLEATENETMPALLQEFIPHAKSGDKRVLILGGRAIGAFTRIPGNSDFRANMALGGTAHPAKIDARDRKIAEALRPFLAANGIRLAGIDVLDGRLSEINVTSPAGIPEINAFEGTRLEEAVVDYVEKNIRSRNMKRISAGR